MKCCCSFTSGKNIKDALTSFFLQMVESFDWLTALIELFPEVPSQYWSITVFIFSDVKDLQCVLKKVPFRNYHVHDRSALSKIIITSPSREARRPACEKNLHNLTLLAGADLS